MVADWRGEAHLYAEALAASDRVLALRPNFVPALANRALVLLQLGRRGEAVAAARQTLATSAVELRWAVDANAIYVLAQTGNLAEAAQSIERLLPRWPTDSYVRGFLLMALGRTEEAWNYLDRMPLAWAAVSYWSPVLDAVRDTPRFQEMIMKVGVTGEHKVARETLVRMLKERAEKK